MEGQDVLELGWIILGFLTSRELLQYLSVEDMPHKVGTIRIDFVFEISFKSSPSEWRWMHDRNSIIGCREVVSEKRRHFLKWKRNLISEAALQEVSNIIVVRSPGKCI